MNAVQHMLVGLGLVVAPTLVQAQIFKCVGQEGKTSYQQTPCGESATQTKVSISTGGGSGAWELIDTVTQGSQVIKAYLDVQSVRMEGEHRRGRAKMESFESGKNSNDPSIEAVTEYLVDCRSRRALLLVTRTSKPKQTEIKGPGIWGVFPRPPSVPNVFDRICSISL